MTCGHPADGLFSADLLSCVFQAPWCFGFAGTAASGTRRRRSAGKRSRCPAERSGTPSRVHPHQRGNSPATTREGIQDCREEGGRCSFQAVRPAQPSWRGRCGAVCGQSTQGRQAQCPSARQKKCAASRRGTLSFPRRNPASVYHTITLRSSPQGEGKEQTNPAISSQDVPQTFRLPSALIMRILQFRLALGTTHIYAKRAAQ